MKLWQKNSLIFTSTLVFVVFICSTVLLLYSKNSILDLTRSQAQDKQQNLTASFFEMTSYYAKEDDSIEVRDSLIRYCFSRFADSTCVLIRGKEVLYTGVAINPAEYLLLDGNVNGKARTTEEKVLGRNILLVGSNIEIGNEEYAVYVVEDISTTYNSIANMIWTFIIVSFLCVIAGAGLSALLMRHSTRPLSQLAAAARCIAGGEYVMRTNIHTDDEIGTLSSDFNRMAEAVEARIAELTETAERQRLFIGGVTHEFKTPLTSLLLHAKMLRRAYMTEEEKDNSLEHIETQCEWLERLVQNLLKIIALNEKIEVEPVSLQHLFKRVSQSCTKRLLDKGVVLEISSEDETLSMNADLMQSLLVNLIDNAAKSYDPEVQEKIIRLAVYDKTIEVRDFGRGIPKESLERIFEPFYMVDKSRSKKCGGSGLGLALVKSIADAHGAQIQVESMAGQGTSVRVTLP